MADRLNVYEGMFLLGPAGSMEPEAMLNRVRQMIEHHGGQIIVLKKWDERKLMYELAGQKRGTYIISFFRAPGGAVAGIERDVNLSEDILRVMILRADHLNEQEMAAVEPQPIQPREERPSWDRPSYDNDRPRRDDRAPRHRKDEGVEAVEEIPASDKE